MSYIEDNLLQDEEIIYQAKLHWIIFLWSIIWGVVSIPFFTLKAWSATGGGVVVVIALLTAITPYIKYLTSEFGVTNQRVIVKTGFISRDSSDIMLTKIEGIQVDQEILERVLGYGSIAIIGVGGTKEPFHEISDPLEFREQVEEQVVACSED